MDKRVEILWNDAFHVTDSWLSLEDIAEIYKTKRYQVTNIGWIIFEDKDYIILARKKSENHESYGFVMLIPKGMIVKIKKLK